MATIIGTDGPDTIRTGSQDDTIVGRKGNDQIRGAGGDDLINGRADNDQLFGEDGNDRLHGGAGVDLMFGAEGDDRMWGDAGNDDLHGGDGDDIMLGRDGNDDLWGDLGNDVVLGGIGADNLHGHEGRDVMIGNEGADDFIFNFSTRSNVLDGFNQFDEVDTIITDFFNGTDDLRLSYIQQGEGASGENVVDHQDVFTLPDLDTNLDGVFGAGDAAATVADNNLTLDATKLPGLQDFFPVFGTITFADVTELRAGDFIG